MRVIAQQAVCCTIESMPTCLLPQEGTPQLPVFESDRAGLFITAYYVSGKADWQLRIIFSWLLCRLDCAWIGTGLADVRPYPLTHPFSINIAEAAEPWSVASAEAPLSSLTAEQIASGRRWSAKVVLMSGMQASALHAADPKDFQVTISVVSLCPLAAPPRHPL